MATQTRNPTSDVSFTGTWSAAPRWSAVDDYPDSGNPVADSITHGTTAGEGLFGFSAFSVPAGSTGISVQVKYWVFKNGSQSCNIKARIRCNDTTGRDFGTSHNPGNGNANITSYTDDYGANNPKTGSAWTVDDVNGVGTNGLTAFGVVSTDANPTLTLSCIQLQVTYTPPQNRGQVSFAELEVPNAPRRGRVSFAEAEVPSAPRRVKASWAELEVPTAPRRGRFSWAELELPNAPISPRRGQFSWTEFEVPNAPRKLYVSFAELEAPNAPRRGQVSWGELETPTAPRKLLVSWAEAEVPTAPRRLRMSFTELEAPDAPTTDRRGQISFVELELPTPPRRGQVSWTEFEVPIPPRRGMVSFAELEIPTAPRRVKISWVEMSVPGTDITYALCFIQRMS